MSARIGIIIVAGAICASIVFATYMYTQNQPQFKEVQSGQPVQVGPVVYIIEHIGEHNGNEKTMPEGIFYQIRITAENKGTEETRMSGGQFYLLDENDTKYQPVFGEFTEEDLFNEFLKPNEPINRETQFDISYYEDKTYRVGILPTKVQSSNEIGIVCIQNC